MICIGLAANQRCPDAQMKLVNEAYLLSMRAPAEHDLKIGDWQRDYARANMLLAQCSTWPGLKGSVAGQDEPDRGVAFPCSIKRFERRAHSVQRSPGSVRKDNKLISPVRFVGRCWS